MKIQKIELKTNEHLGHLPLQFKDNEIVISEPLYNKETLLQFIVTLDSKDILKLMTWLVGQEKHTQEKLTSLRKKLNQIRDEVVDYECGNMTVVEGWDKIKEIISNKNIKDL